MMTMKKCLILSGIFTLGIAFSGSAQEGRVNIQQNEMIPALLDTKTEMAQDGALGDRFRIQLFSGDNNQASKVIKEYRLLFPQWPSTVVYETPNYKVWVGNFRNSLEADKALLEIKTAFPAAFRLKPETR